MEPITKDFATAVATALRTAQRHNVAIDHVFLPMPMEALLLLELKTPAWIAANAVREMQESRASRSVLGETMMFMGVKLTGIAGLAYPTVLIGGRMFTFDQMYELLNRPHGLPSVPPLPRLLGEGPTE